MDSDSEEDEESDDNENEFDIIQASKNKTVDASSTLGIQKKLALKILPQLQRHLTEIKTKVATNEATPIRGYVAICIAKLIRKLPVSQFTN